MEYNKYKKGYIEEKLNKKTIHTIVYHSDKSTPDHREWTINNFVEYIKKKSEFLVKALIIYEDRSTEINLAGVFAKKKLISIVKDCENNEKEIILRVEIWKE